MSSVSTTRRPGKGRRRRETARESQGLTAREKATLTAIEDWYRRNVGKGEERLEERGGVV